MLTRTDVADHACLVCGGVYPQNSARPIWNPIDHPSWRQYATCPLVAAPADAAKGGRCVRRGIDAQHGGGRKWYPIDNARGCQHTANPLGAARANAAEGACQVCCGINPQDSGRIMRYAVDDARRREYATVPLVAIEPTLPNVSVESMVGSIRRTAAAPCGMP